MLWNTSMTHSQPGHSGKAAGLIRYPVKLNVRQ